MNVWANIHSNETSHAAHAHPEALVSGVYYAQVPLGSGEIVFEPSFPPTQETSSEASPLESIRFLPQDGQVLIFPSWLTHSVLPSRLEQSDRTLKASMHTSKTLRVSLAFNLVESLF
mmetsp:Transcript_24369/g.38386  ORF Transcript_24369/g.38386 Transcript_24369/m.38386 type:complete len:117 (-) Transcript_24369:68-418(-)